MHKRLAPGRAEANALLERYDHEYETDFELASRAAEVAAEVLRLSGGSSVPAGLVNVISFGTVSPPQIPATGKRILDAVSKWEELAPGLSSIIALDDLTQRPTQLYTGGGGSTQGAIRSRRFSGNTTTHMRRTLMQWSGLSKVAADVIQLAGQLPVPAGLVRLTTQPTTVTSDLVLGRITHP